MHPINNLAELGAMLNADLSRYDTQMHTNHAGIRLDQAMTEIAQAIREVDRTALVLGYRVIMADPHLPFGKIHP